MKCVLVTGIGCGGTSAVAGVIHKMGCPMYVEGHSHDHPDSGAGLYEDECLYGQLYQMTPETIAAVRQVIQTHRRDPYGFKNTLLGRALPWVVPLVQDARDEPRVVVVHRTLVSSIEGRMAGRCCVPFGRQYSREEAGQWAVDEKIALLQSVRTVEAWGVPTLHLSFEHLLADPATQIERLAAFLGLEATEEALAHVKPKLVHY